MSRLTDLIARTKADNPALGAELEREYKVLTSRLPFGLNFERHRPEAVELPGVPIRMGDKVRVLPPRGSTARGDKRLWQVRSINREGGTAKLELLDGAFEHQEAQLDDLIVVADFRDRIYPGLVNTGKVERGGDKPYHTVINGENYHVLKALTYTHRGKIDAIYIDPPYNTGARDWKYNNDYVESDDLYRHSKWLAMMERRLLVAKELLNPDDSVLIVTIDEKEYLRLGLLLEQLFPQADIQMISSLINPAAVARAGGFGRTDEYIYVVMFGDSVPQRIQLDREWVSARGRTHTGNIRWDLLRRSGPGATRADSPGGFYAIYVDPHGPRVAAVGEALPAGTSSPEEVPGTVAVLPIRRDGSEGRWQWTASTFRDRLKQGRVRITGNEHRGFVVSILKDGEYRKIQDGEFNALGINENGTLEVEPNSADRVRAIPGTQWRISSHDSTQYGTRLLAKLLPGRRFPFPKSLYAVEDVLSFFVINKPTAIILDFFAGSGTTAHAVMRLNRLDGGYRQCISVTNNEVSVDEQRQLIEKQLRPGDLEWEALGICEYVTKPRLTAAITGLTPDGVEISGPYTFNEQFPMAEGLEENAAFLTLTYESADAVNHNIAFERIAPLLWLRAGSQGRLIQTLPEAGWDLAEVYGLLTDLDQAGPFVETLATAEDVQMVFIVTDDNRRFQAVVRQLPEGVEAVRLYESYLTNFSFLNEDGA